MKEEFKNFNDRAKDVLNDNDLSPENIIYDETQIGPQEEPFLFEYSLDLNAWQKYLLSLDKKNRE